LPSIWQADIGDDGIGRALVSRDNGLLAVEGAVRHIAGIGQHGGELANEIRIVLKWTRRRI